MSSFVRRRARKTQEIYTVLLTMFLMCVIMMSTCIIGIYSGLDSILVGLLNKSAWAIGCISCELSIFLKVRNNHRRKSLTANFWMQSTNSMKTPKQWSVDREIEQFVRQSSEEKYWNVSSRYTVNQQEWAKAWGLKLTILQMWVRV